LQGKRRILITMATGTGKTVTAFQICWKLWNSRWNRDNSYRKPRILFLADRNVLIDDGFLAPYRVHRVITAVDAAGWRPSKGELDRYGREIPDGEYQTKDFERVIALRSRTVTIAKHLTDYMRRTDRFAKTMVFCVNQEHADEMRRALNNLNADLVQKHPNYVVRVTSEEGKIGKGHLSRFQELETTTPVILTTSKLLTTGIDAPTCKNVVLARVVNSMTEFKQIIGRGTRLREDYGKLWFSIIDYTGSATKNFADPDFVFSAHQN
jgi:type I restriction enzyme R subunit